MTIYSLDVQAAGSWGTDIWWLLFSLHRSTENISDPTTSLRPTQHGVWSDNISGFCPRLQAQVS